MWETLQKFDDEIDLWKDTTFKDIKTKEILNKLEGYEIIGKKAKNHFNDKGTATNHLLKQLFGYGLDPNQNMTNFNPLNLNHNQTEQLSILNRGFCYKESYKRGAGSVVSYCNETIEDKDGSLCYPKCDEGYTGNGPICWEVCKPGFTDRGTFCIIDLDVINKDCCCAFDDECCNNCPKNYTDDGCTCRRYYIN